MGDGPQTSVYGIRCHVLESWQGYALRLRQSQSPDPFQTGKYDNTIDLWESIVEVGRDSKCGTLSVR